MGILNDVEGWVFIFLAAANASGPLRKLVKARRSGARFSVIPAWVWSGLFLSLVFLVNGVHWLRHTDSAGLDWILVPLGLAGLMSLAVPGIASRRRAGVPWWRFWARVIPPPSADGFTGLGEDSHPLPRPADTPGPMLATALDARTLGLMERIKNARFSTVRLSAGYDEEEVDTFLDKLIAVLGEGGQPDQAELRNARFATTRLRPGYAIRDVDGFLHEIAGATPF